MGRHKKIERKKELDRQRRRREKNLKLRKKQQKTERQGSAPPVKKAK
jgi:nucleotide-binding universal stress UspA family protein